MIATCPRWKTTPASRQVAEGGIPLEFVIPAEACHGRGTCPHYRARNIEAVHAFESSVPVIPAQAGIHEWGYFP